MKTKLIAILVASILYAAPFQAATSSGRIVFKDSLGTVIDAVKDKNGVDQYNIGYGKSFSAEVYLTQDVAWGGFGCALGWGTASSVGGTDLSGDFSYKSKALNTLVFGQISSAFGGFAGSDIRPYGNYTAAGVKSAAQAAGVDIKVITFQLNNLMALGDTGTVCLWNAGSGYTNIADRSTKITNYSNAFVSAPPTVNYSLTSVPEPSSMMAMGCAGVGVLGDLLRRRRKKLAVNK